jgi:hypothetical protein
MHTETTRREKAQCRAMWGQPPRLSGGRSSLILADYVLGRGRVLDNPTPRFRIRPLSVAPELPITRWHLCCR